MDRRAQILTRTLAAGNSLGEQVPTYSVLTTVWAEKIELTGSEQILAQQVSAETEITFRIHWRSDVTATARLIVEGQTYSVTRIAELGRRAFLLVTVKGIVP